ncbi:MAG TPA: cupredoxin domain-containing protein [Dongiaceae bacterium]|nr:cupredoxin domain-containing protein [Dongiaceae bacterium]
MRRHLSSLPALTAFLGAALLLAVPARAEDALVFNITIKEHKFEPAEVRVPAGKPIILVVKNADATAEEFESHALKVEKVIPGGQQGTVRLRPLAAGSYAFVGEFHEDTAKGAVIAE